MLRGKVAWGEKEIAGTIDTQVHCEEFPKRILKASSPALSLPFPTFLVGTLRPRQLLIRTAGD